MSFLTGLAWQTVDDYTDTDLSEYYNESSGWTQDGGYAKNGSSSVYTLASTSGLPTYPKQGKEFTFNLDNNSSSHISRVLVGVQSETSNPDGYEFELDTISAGGWQVNLYRIQNGSKTTLDSAFTDNWDNSLYLPSKIWWEGVWSHNGDLKGTLYGDTTGGGGYGPVVTLSGQDTTFTSGGIGVDASYTWINSIEIK